MYIFKKIFDGFHQITVINDSIAVPGIVIYVQQWFMIVLGSTVVGSLEKMKQG